MENTNEMKWYVVKTISGKEEKVKNYIQRELELNKMSKYVAQMLIPTEKVYQIKNGKKVNKERNFFPGYILLEAKLFAELIHLIRNLTGVITFLGIIVGISISLISFNILATLITPLSMTGISFTLTKDFFLIMLLVLLSGIFAAVFPAYRGSKISVAKQLSENI